jgi:hypothetical protein
MTEQATNSGRWHVWLMIAMLAGVIVAGFLMFPKTEEQRNSLLSRLGTTNHGEFVLPPVPMADLELMDTDQSTWRLADQKVKWRMVIAGAGSCVEQCREMLYLTRQVHISLGKYSRRFERLYFSLGEDLVQETSEYIKLNHPFLKVLKADKHIIETMLKETNAPLQLSGDGGTMRAYLVDQKGLIMMSYSLANEGNEIIEDIEHLMKYSPQ